MTEKEVRMRILDQYGHGSGEFRATFVQAEPPRVHVYLASSCSGSFDGALSLSDFAEMFRLQGAIARSIHDDIVAHEQARREHEQTAAADKQGGRIDQGIAAIIRLAESTQNLAQALRPAPKVRRKGRVRR